MRYEKVNLGDLETGDQIAISGNMKNLHPLLVPLTLHTDSVYFHHGIFDKENLAVYDFYGDNKENARPQKRDFTAFFAGHSQLYRVVYEDGEHCLPAYLVIMRAKEAVLHQSSWPYYHLISNNCESFATFLKTGCQYSEQVFTAFKQFCKKAAPVALVVGVTTGSPLMVTAGGMCVGFALT